jgi:hypothetical protein
MMRFFTNGTWRPRAPLEEIPTPVGDHCLACGHAIQADDCGVSMIHLDLNSSTYRLWHLSCFRTAIGIERVDA